MKKLKFDVNVSWQRYDFLCNPVYPPQLGNLLQAQRSCTLMDILLDARDFLWAIGQFCARLGEQNKANSIFAVLKIELVGDIPGNRAMLASAIAMCSMFDLRYFLRDKPDIDGTQEIYIGYWQTIEACKRQLLLS